MLILLHGLIAALFAPGEWGVVLSVLGAYVYLAFIWFFGGLFISDIMHMGIAHKSLNFRPWFVKSIVLLWSTLGIYTNPTTWVNRHRHHHAFSDAPGDPNKQPDDGFFKTIYLCLVPYECRKNLATERIFQTKTFRLVSTPYFAVFSQFSSFGVLWLAVRDWVFALTLWVSVRLLALWANMLQNYWTHDRRYGTRRYEDDDNAMNLGDWLPVTVSFGASLQNNHHHYQNFLRTSHDHNEYDFGFLTVRAMSKLGLVKPSTSGAQIPEGVRLTEVGI